MRSSPTALSIAPAEGSGEPSAWRSSASAAGDVEGASWGDRVSHGRSRRGYQIAGHESPAYLWHIVSDQLDYYSRHWRSGQHSLQRERTGESFEWHAFQET